MTAGILRATWALLSVFAVESLVFGLAVLPGVLFWEWHWSYGVDSRWLRVVFLSMAFIPAYVLFAITLIVLSGLATRLTGWRTPEETEIVIADFSWPLLDWARYTVSIHLVRVFAGPLFRSTPVWSFYMRWNGARVGKRVYVNSLAVTDHNLLDLGDDVVIGGDAHLSGHTVEKGRLKTARVRLGRGVTVGVGSVIGIGVEAGDGCQIGALSFVPKFEKLEAGAVYAGTPVKKLAVGARESPARMYEEA
jgi:acetyltransferase-like isoleucine patch superfamily enzyme